nr:MAG TPA: hypothetical protein [Caudoviricetes sp.]DAV21077.1 MAG TPA: hypothetical protein [Caudoviricetes sp.]
MSPLGKINIQHSTLKLTFNIKSRGAGVITTAAPLDINKTLP